jgi:hypothetical protein
MGPPITINSKGGDSSEVGTNMNCDGAGCREGSGIRDVGGGTAEHAAAERCAGG